MGILIRLKDELINFPFINLDNLSTRNNFPEHVKNAVALYNKAIDRIKFNSNDIAMIELKKAIKIFPEFYDAILLLSLCYYANDEKTRSINLLNTIKDEEERKKCFKYMNNVVGKSTSGGKAIRMPESGARGGNYSSSAQRTVQRRTPQETNRNQRKAPARNSSQSVSLSFKKILNNPFVFRVGVLIIIVLIIAGAIYGLITLFNVNKQQGEQNVKLAEYESKYNQELLRAEEAVRNLMEFKENDEELITQYILPWLLTMNKESEYETIVKVIYLLDTSVIKNEEASMKIQSLNNDALFVFGDKIYSKAENNITELKNDEAIAQLESIIRYHPNYGRMPKVKLELGKVYKTVGNKEKAKEVFNNLIEYHGQSLEVVEARNELAQLSE